MRLLLRFKLLTMYHIFALFAMRSAWDGRRYMGGGVTAGFETVVSTSGKDLSNHEPCIDAVVITTAITDYDIFGAGQ